MEIVRPYNKRRILALDLGRRELGYAVLDDADLFYFGIHTFQRFSSSRALARSGRRYVGGLIDGFSPDVLVVERMTVKGSRRSPFVHRLAEELKSFGRERGLRIVSHRPGDVRTGIAHNGKATKTQIAEILVGEYPFLEKYLAIDRRTHERYWENMFDAVALGRLGFEMLQDSERSSDSGRTTRGLRSPV